MNKKITLKEKLIFGAGDLYGGGAQVIVSFLYLYFLTEVVGIRPAYAGTIVLVSRLWDGINDPLMGRLTDNTKSKLGRRKPYFLAGFFLIIISYCLLWSSFRINNEIITFIIALVSYLFYATINTMVMVPYSAMSAEITPEYQERNTVNGFRLFFSQLSSAIAAILPLTIINAFSSKDTGYMVMGLVFGIFYAIPFLLIFLYIKDKPVIKNNHEKFTFRSFIKPFKIKAFRALVGLYICAFITMDIVSAVFSYYMDYYLKREDDLTVVLGILLVSVIVMLPIVVKIANKIGKKQSFILGGIIAIIGAVLLSVISPNQPAWYIYVIASIIGIGLAPCVSVPWLMFPDVTDVGEFAFNERKEGSFSGIMTFVRQSSSAIAIFIVSLILDFVGYIKPTQEVIDGKLVITKFAQPQQVITALKFIVTIFPLFLLSLAIYFAVKYPLTINRFMKMRDFLDNKEELNEEEVNALRKELI